MHQSFRPTAAQMLAATNKTVPDVVAPNLRVLFCGINPGLYTAAVGHHFARPGNRFWPALLRAGFTDQLLSPFEERELLSYGCGITNVVGRATAKASDLTTDELLQGGAELLEKVRSLRPCIVAFLGIGAYRTAFSRPRACLGLQPERMGEAKIWLLPNPSGINAHYRMDALVGMLEELRSAVQLHC